MGLQFLPILCFYIIVGCISMISSFILNYIMSSPFAVLLLLVVETVSSALISITLTIVQWLSIIQYSSLGSILSFFSFWFLVFVLLWCSKFDQLLVDIFAIKQFRLLKQFSSFSSCSSYKGIKGMVIYTRCWSCRLLGTTEKAHCPI